MAKLDSFSVFDDVLSSSRLTSPWVQDAGVAPRYEADYGTLAKLLSIPIAAGEPAESGRFAAGIDSWLSFELRRAGFALDEVWPRPNRPRILPHDIAVLITKLPSALAEQVREKVAEIPAVAPSNARILGRAYDKQVDVAIARWDRGPELMISTKAQGKSFGKNLGNRFEEAYGDAGNLRARYPLAAVGYFFVQRANVLTHEPGAFERTKDMVRKLRELEGNNGYTATGLALADWDDDDPGAGVRIILEPVPVDIRPDQFLEKMITRVLDVTPVVHHREARSLYEARDVPVEITDLAESIVGDAEVNPDEV